MEYELLDIARNEIRVITLLPSRDWPYDSDDISCSIENVSLTDYIPLYEHFLAEKGRGIEDAVYSQLSTPWLEFHHLTFDHSEPFLNGQPIDDLNFPSLWRFKWGDFAALSYAWFEPLLVEKTIFINRHPLVVTGNLHAALLCLRNRLTRGLKLWVDAICINQKDLAERNLQVKRMGSIYRQALNTIVWPGAELIGTWKVFRFLRTLGIAHQQGRELAKSIIIEESKRQDLDM